MLDEADRMLSLGFTEELDAILKLLPSKKQTLLFSATFPEQVKTLTHELLNDPIEVQLQSANASTLVQRVFEVEKAQDGFVSAPDSTTRMATSSRSLLMRRTAVTWQTSFTNAVLLRKYSTVIKGRVHVLRILEDFKSGEIRDVLIATDIAAWSRYRKTSSGDQL